MGFSHGLLLIRLLLPFHVPADLQLLLVSLQPRIGEMNETSHDIPDLEFSSSGKGDGNKGFGEPIPHFVFF